MSANVALTDTFDQWRVKSNELLVMTQTDGMSNFVKLLDTTNSTSNTTGSIITAGGVGIAKCVVIGEDLRVHGDVITDGDTTISGNLIFGDAATDQVTFTADINSSVIPNANVTFNLGNTTMLWANTFTGHVGVTQKSDSGKAAVSVTSQDVDQIAVEVTASQTTADVVQLTADSVTTARVIDISSDALTTGSAIYVDSDSSSTATRSIVNIIQNHASATGSTALNVQSDAGKGIFIDSNLAGGGPALEIDSEHETATAVDINVDGTTTATAVSISADGLVTGTAFAVDSDSSDTGTRNIASIIQNHTGASGSTTLYVRNDHATADAIKAIGAVTVGVNDTGHDVKFFGATSGQYMLWDESADELVLTGDSKLSFHDAAGGENIIATSDGHLEVNAGTTLDITAPTVDINASTALNIDGVTQINNTVTVGVDNTGYDIKFFGATASKYWLWDESADQTVLIGSSTQTGNAQLTGTLTVGVNDTGHDVKLFGATSGSYWLWDESADQVKVVGTSHQTGSSSLIGSLTVGVNDTGHDVKFFGATSGAYMLWDESADDLILSGSAQLSIDNTADASSTTDGSFHTDGGVGIAKKLYVGTDLAVDGTSNLDAVDIDGATQIDGTVTVGVNDTGYDVKFFGATSGSYMLWDESADALLLTDSSPIKCGDGADLSIYHSGTHSYIDNATGTMHLATNHAGIAVSIGHTTSETTVRDNLTVTGDLTESSMREMKTNISNIENILPTVMQLQGVSFDWKKDKDNDKRSNHYGFIAEDVNKVLPNLVSYSEEGKPTGVQYSKMTAVLLEAIKEQQVQIDELKAKIN